MQLKLENVFFKYKREKDFALKGINLEIKKGITVIVGENGSGKSTLLSLLNIMNLPTEGKLYLDDKELKNIKKKSLYRKDILTVYQFSDMQLFNLKVIDDLLYSIRLNNFDEQKALIDIEKYFEKFNLPLELLEYSPFKLSGGQKKKVAIISALILKPKILLLDEPTVGIDNDSKGEILKVIKELKRDIKIVMVLHDMDIAHFLGDYIVEMKSGQIIENTTVKNFFDKKYVAQEEDKIPYLYQIFSYLKLEKSDYESIKNEEDLLIYIKDKYELY